MKPSLPKIYFIFNFFPDSDSGSSSGSESDAAKASVPADILEVHLNVRK